MNNKCPSFISIEKEVDLSSVVINLRDLNEIFRDCFEISRNLVEYHYSHPDPGEYRLFLKGIIDDLENTHYGIMTLYNEGEKQDYKPIWINAIPLIRGQVEWVYSVALLIREPDKYFPDFGCDGLKKFFFRHVLEKEETKKLPQFKKINNQNYIRLAKDLLILKNFNNENLVSRKDLEEIENHVKNGKRYRGYKFPNAGEIKDILPYDANDPIKTILCRLFSDYIWLCEFVHGSIHKFIAINSLQHNVNPILFEHEVTIGNLMLNYLSILIILTDILKVINQKVKLRGKLLEGWNIYKGCSIRSSFYWDTWAKIAMDF
jgi:hypothetical protein